MKVYNNIKEIQITEPTAIALGKFDGIHLGHRKLIETAMEKAGEEGIKSAVFTFTNHPINLIEGRMVVKMILNIEEKERLLNELGLDYAFDIAFTEEIRHMSPERFIKELLVGRFKAKHVFCGAEHRFGARAAGDVDLLKKMGAELGFETHIIDRVDVDGRPVSSTYIRHLIENGLMEECEKYLGRYYSIGGKVVEGNKLGRTIGFPTANLVADDALVTPSNGVYVTYCICNGKRYPSVTNVGVKPTIGNYNKNAETHIFDFDEDLYGRDIEVEFLKKTRDERKFGSVQELSEQINRDCMTAREYHGI